MLRTRWQSVIFFKELQHIREELEGHIARLDQRIQGIQKKLKRLSPARAGSELGDTQKDVTAGQSVVPY